MLPAKPQSALILIAFSALLYWPECIFAMKKDTPHPAEVVRLIEAARHTGWTRLTVWGFEVYDARLWTDAAFNAEVYESHRFALEISYLRDFDSTALADRSIKEMRRIATATDAQALAWHQRMRQLFPAIRQGDRLVGLHTPGVGAVFTFNGKVIGEVRDPEFARQFFGIWLSSKTSEPSMRRALLGLDSPRQR